MPLKRLLLILSLLIVGSQLFAQGEDRIDFDDKLPILGRIVTSDSLLPVRNTHVISKMAHCGTISNREGMFFIPAKTIDTLWISCLGYRRQLLPVDSTLLGIDTLLVVLHPDTITLKEVTVMPLYDYETFKQMIIDMPTKETPRELKRLEEDLASMRTGRKRNPYLNMENGGIVASPIQYLYDQFNASARLKKKLIRNRRMFNEILKEQGRIDELLPDSLDYPVEYRVYEYEDIK